MRLRSIRTTRAAEVIGKLFEHRQFSAKLLDAQVNVGRSRISSKQGRTNSSRRQVQR
jgi:hypothetical protein